MDILNTIYKVLFWISLIASIIGGIIAVVNWYLPIASHNPYGGIIEGIVEIGAIVLCIVAGLFAYFFYKMLP